MTNTWKVRYWKEFFRFGVPIIVVLRILRCLQFNIPNRIPVYFWSYLFIDIGGMFIATALYVLILKASGKLDRNDESI
jgi:hypothetical protein